ncbi:MAG: 50S ribosomal protein L13 [Candidatus Eisenbacteria bacterium]|nr:50S ribosomal protein L13 [Candidatus Eisenbacteria bacterium]
MSTYATKASDVVRQWLLVDADGQILGRLASEVAYLLRGKGKPGYVPYLDMGDHVVVINAGKFRVTGRKMEQKTYFRHTGYIGGGRMTTMADRMAKHPSEVIRDAVWGMLPKGPLGRQMVRKLKIYEGPDHPHQAQMPRVHKLGSTGRDARTETAG